MYEVSGCTACPALCESRTRIVNGVGPDDAELLFIGEAPGADEDEQGAPFVGRSGDVLDDALEAAGLDRADVRITNTVRCRPEENRDPTSDERANCRDHLVAEIVAVDPCAIVTLGKVPSETLLSRSVQITKEVADVDTWREYPVVLSPHPAAVIYPHAELEDLITAFTTARGLAE